ncbi:MAG: prepilin-type N-terminal cleavage/methylation domain-containing protein [Nitrospira sp.]|nr:prepilin-type N-terminal cleavage/methylation domain-containing protein [Nitrospira sp.]
MNLKLNNNGFTLLELLISITLSVIVLAILFAGMRLGYKSQEKGKEREEISQRMRILGDRITWLLRGAYPYIITRPEGKKVYFMGKSDTIGFVTTSVENTAEGPEDRAGLKWVSLSVDSSGLKLREAVYFLEDVFEDTVGKTYIIDPTVQKIDFEYLDSPDQDIEAIWETEWDPSEKNYIPSAVKVRIVFKYNDKDIRMPDLIVKVGSIRK